MRESQLKQLKIFYVFVLVLGTILVAPTHIFPQPFFMPLRFPHYLEMMKPFLGVSWPTTFKIYHYVIYSLIILGSLNALGIILYPKLKKIAILSSKIGVFLISCIILFLFFPFMRVNPPTAIIYGCYSIILLIADILTFRILHLE